MVQRKKRRQRRMQQIETYGQCDHRCACGCEQRCNRHKGHGSNHQYITPTGLRVICKRREAKT